MDINRKIAYDVLDRVINHGAFANVELNNSLTKKEDVKPALIREIVYGTLENLIYIDYVLDKLIAKGIKSVKKKVKVILEMSIYQLAFMNSLPDYAVVNEGVNLCKKISPQLKNFVNGVLRSYIRQGEDLEKSLESESKLKYLEVKYSAHKSIVKLLVDQLGLENAEIFLKFSTCRKDLSIRVNSLKTNIDTLTKVLQEKGFSVEKSTLSNKCLKVRGESLTELEEYRNGLFSIQSEPSSFIAEKADTKPGEHIIDVCAAPGGKTFAMAEEMNNRGQVVACDIYKHRVELINKAKLRLSIDIVKAIEADGTVFLREFENWADKVLVDAPCSGLGVIRSKPEIKLKALENIEELPKIQLKILNNVKKYVKINGRLIYSTCTINFEENQRVVQKFLDENREFSLVEERQLTPWEDGVDGFFFALMEKKGVNL